MISVCAKLRKSGPGTSALVVYHLESEIGKAMVGSGVKIRPELWDEKRQRIMASSSPSEQSAAMAASKRVKWDLCTLANLCAEGRTPEEAVDKWKKIRRPSNFVYRMEEATLRLLRAGHRSTSANYESTLQRLQEFAGDNIDVHDITREKMQIFETWLKARGLRPNSTSFYMRILRCVYRRCVAEGLMTDVSPFAGVYTGVDRTRKRAITFDEMKRIKALDLNGKPALTVARDVFFFSFYCRGMSLVDLAHLTRHNLSQHELTYCRRKTGQCMNIGLNPQIKGLIDKYDSEGKYLLPIISDEAVDEDMEYKSKLRTLNKHLHKIGRQASLAAPLTTYVARHTWATLARMREVPISVISEALGHDSVTTTEIYLASIDCAAVDRANERVIEGL